MMFQIDFTLQLNIISFISFLIYTSLSNVVHISLIIKWVDYYTYEYNILEVFALKAEIHSSK